MPKVKLTSSDNQEFKVDLKIAKMSKTVSVMMEALEMDEDADDKAFDAPVPLPNVDATTLAKVIEWCEKHKDDPVKEKKDDDDEKEDHEVPKEDKEWLDAVEKKGQKLLFGLLVAANYMDIRGLMEAVAKKVASMIRGKTTEKIRETFNIVKDLTDEEEAAIRKENAWCDN